LVILSNLLMFSAAGLSAQTEKRDAYLQEEVIPFFENYCVSCHNADDAMAGIRVDHVGADRTFLVNRKNWLKVSAVLRFGAMPPESADQPHADLRGDIYHWLSEELDTIDCNLAKDPGRVTIRRLNRLEYDNTIRDLFGVDFRLAEDFPSDDVGEGFDNIGDVLTLPPLLFEKYFDAGTMVSQRVVYVPDSVDGQEIVFDKDDVAVGGGGRIEGKELVFFSNGRAVLKVDITNAGTYQFSIDAGAEQAGSELAKMKIEIDGKVALTESVSATRQRPRSYRADFKLAKGSHEIGVSFINDYYNPKNPDPQQRDRNLYFSKPNLSGPVEARMEDLSVFNQSVAASRPDDAKDAAKAALSVLSPLVHRAFRREVSDVDIKPFADLVGIVMAQEASYERGIQVAINAILVSPRFLFRVEGGVGADDAARVRRLDDYELASRLSYFIWCSTPDDRLLSLAHEGKLSQPRVLVSEVERMIQDPRSAGMTEGFATQWLNLRTLSEVTPDPTVYKFDESLRDSMTTETKMFFEHVLRENRPVLDFLNAKYTFVNGTLASHYGVDGPEGDAFVQVSLEGKNRAGILTHASILTLTSNPNRSSPVMRGKWIMENVLGVRPPDPPEDVPEIDAAKESLPEASFRAQLELHRENSVCASCHNHMDPLGFGFENFDGIGRFRSKDGEFDIDASGILPSGEKFTGPLELVNILTKRGDAFARALSRRMLVFALGRGLEYYDECAIDKIVKELKRNNYQMQSLVTAIVLSDPFLKRRGEGVKK